MDPVMASAAIGVGALIVNALVWATGARSNKATEKDAMVARYAAAAKWSNEWAEGLERKIDEARADVETLRTEVEQMKGRLLRLAAFVRHVLDEWEQRFPDVAHPKIWADIVHLIDPRQNEKGGE